ncbi:MULTISPECIES: methanobactin export MATE transporter MbnM [unclassified Marinobacter]|uniref:methanobactin export MATE transporter MbnM n=1 Tax=unclassified Marinobacter TaxID=83889 RepID=UPI0026E3F29F|nr:MULTISPECIES: methanobactin export MATE transporter MbnM [unclassified Marinobacter]MDO6441782.1 di-heme enzyme [Marinobacter sp. 2_MG-2023]MDO6824833.1 di-heme enzyme [Marinobacter sp. 1_MG-2023]
MILLSGCLEQSQTTVDDQGARISSFDWGLPEHIPLPREPEDNPMTEEKFQLGRHLFYDTRLSSNGTISCSSCHHQDKAFSDGLAQASGATGERHPRNSQALVNVAWNNTLTWANPSLGTIEKQIMIPLFGDDPIEHGLNEGNHEQVLRSLQAEPEYASLFAAAFPDQADPLFDDLAWDNVVKALASFVRGLSSFDSDFDRGAMSAAALRGERLFNSERLECFHCHAGYNFTDATTDRLTTYNTLLFHNTGLYNIDGLGAYPEPNTGRHEVTGRADHMGQFRAPSLRNVALTAPYNHDGSVDTLEDVIRNYAAGGRLRVSPPNAGDGRMNPLKDGFIASFPITEDEIQDVVAFLESLTDQAFVTNPRFANPWTDNSNKDLIP